MLRIISECLPRYAIFENVSALLTGDSGRWFAQFLYDLAEIGYDAEWHCIPASFINAPHHRDRVWIVAYTNSDNDSRKESRKLNEKESLQKQVREKVSASGFSSGADENRRAYLRSHEASTNTNMQRCEREPTIENALHIEIFKSLRNGKRNSRWRVNDQRRGADIKIHRQVPIRVIERQV